MIIKKYHSKSPQNQSLYCSELIIELKELPCAEWAKLRPEVIGILSDKGVLIEGNDFLEAGVDESEIIYFDPAALQQAKEISAALRQKFINTNINIKIQEIYRPERGPAKLLSSLKIII